MKCKLTNVFIKGRYINPETQRPVNVHSGTDSSGRTRLFYLYRQRRHWITDFYNWYDVKDIVGILTNLSIKAILADSDEKQSRYAHVETTFKKYSKRVIKEAHRPMIELTSEQVRDIKDRKINKVYALVNATLRKS